MRMRSSEGVGMAAMHLPSALACVAVFLCSGCYSWTAIQPTELPQLNGGHIRQIGTTYTGDSVAAVYEVSVAHVLAPDGRTVEAKGEFDARLEGLAGQHLEFAHPVISELEDGTLVVQGANRGRTTIPLNEVERVEVSQFDSGLTTLFSMAMILAGIGLGSVAAYAIISNSD